MSTFSLSNLRELNPGYFRHITWSRSEWPDVPEKGAYIHMGCGTNVLDGFVNLDFIPECPGVVEWESMTAWPDRLFGKVAAFYSEDFIEHFFLNEQMYLYCSMNCLLTDRGLVRTLTPNMDLLWRYGLEFNLEDCLRRGDDYYVSALRCRSGMDAVNLGMRMGGHRWLHTPDSLARVASACGFSSRNSSCDLSSEQAMCGINIRKDGTGLSFALEMSKCRPLHRIIVPPSQVLNAEFVEEISRDQMMYRAIGIDPHVVYDFSPLNVGDVALANIRGANLSQFREHSFAKCYFRRCEAGAICLDRTLQSVPYMNIFNSDDISVAMGEETALSSIRFDPSEHEEEYFTVGPLELFVFSDPPERKKLFFLPPEDEVCGCEPDSGEAEAEARLYKCRYGEISCLPFDRPIADSLSLYGEWAQNELDCLLKFIPVGGTVLDAGAHVGGHSLAFAGQIGPDGTVISIEPQRRLFALLQDNISRNAPGVGVPIHAAAVAEAGTVYMPACGEGWSHNYGSMTLAGKGKGNPVRGLTIDSLELAALDFLKIDAEGSTRDALSGAQSTLKRLRPVAALECNDFLQATACVSMLDTLGYICCHCLFAAYNPNNIRSEQWNIFGVAEEGMLICIPSEKMRSLKRFLPASSRIVRNGADLIGAFIRGLSYGEIRPRGTEPWRLMLSWAADIRGRKEAEFNELITAFRSAGHAERAGRYFAAYAERNEFLCGLEKRVLALRAQDDEDIYNLDCSNVWDGDCTREMRRLLTERPHIIPNTQWARRELFAPSGEPDEIVWEQLRQRRAAGGGSGGPVYVAVPVFNAREYVLPCLHSVLSADCSTPFELVVIDDAGTDPVLAEKLRRLADMGLLRLIKHERNMGFVHSANEAFMLFPERDVILLNSDTLVFDGWLDRLRTHALSDDKTATVTPMSNNATIYSYPPILPDESADLCEHPENLHRIVARINSGESIEIPTAVGFCMYVRRGCLDEIGLFDQDNFGRGYGEENDLCLRASAAGWRHKLAMDVYVWHKGEQSFGPEALNLRKRAFELLCRLYPDYKENVHSFIRRAPLGECHDKILMERRRMANSSTRYNILFVTHNWGGGTERVMQDICAILSRQGVGVFVLRPAFNGKQCLVSLNTADFLFGPNDAAFDLPDDLYKLAHTLDDMKIRHVHVFCLAGYHAAMPDMIILLCRLLNIAFDFTANEFLFFCPHGHGVGADGRFCGIAGEHECEYCLRTEPPWTGYVDIRRWRERYVRFMKAARKVFAPSEYMAEALRGFIPGLKAYARPNPELAPPKSRPEPLLPEPGEDIHIIVIGAIGKPKGMDILLACAADAQTRGLPLRFTVCGYTCDDGAAEAMGIRVTGAYKEKDALSVAASCKGHMAFLPSIWPETYCYTLSVAAFAGLFPVVFNLGAQAERVKSWGWGLVLPFSDITPDLAPSVNDAFLNARIASPPTDIVERIVAPGRFEPDYFTEYYGLRLSAPEM